MLPTSHAPVAQRDRGILETLENSKKQKKINERRAALFEVGCALLISAISLQATWKKDHVGANTSLPSSFPTSMPTYQNITPIHTDPSGHHADNLYITIKIATALATFAALGPKSLSIFLNLHNMRKMLKKYLDIHDHQSKEILFIRYKLMIKLAIRGIFSNNPVLAEALSFRLIDEFTQARFTQQIPTELQQALTLTHSLFEGQYVQSRIWAFFPLLLIAIAVMSAVLLSNLFQPQNTTKNSAAIIGFCVSLVYAAGTITAYIFEHSEHFRSFTSITALEHAISIIKKTEQNAELLIADLLRQLGTANSATVNNSLEQLDNTQANELLASPQPTASLSAISFPAINISALGMFRHTALESLENIELDARTNYQNILDDTKEALRNLQSTLHPYKSSEENIQTILKAKQHDVSDQSKLPRLLNAVTSLKQEFSRQNSKKAVEICNVLDAFTDITNKLTLSLKIYNDVERGTDHLQPIR